MQVVQTVTDIKDTMLTKVEFSERRGTSRCMRRPRLNIGNPIRTHNQKAGLLVLLSKVTITRYNLPIGTIVVSHGEQSSDQDTCSSEKYTIGGRWEFHPASWLSHKSIITEAILAIRSRTELARPTINATLTCKVALSDENPVWGCIHNADIVGVQRLLSSGAVRINDTDTTDGLSLLHAVCA
jgi:hypothetical protein